MYIFDKGIGFSKRRYTDEGYLVAPAVLARTGIQDYYAYQMGLTDRDPLDVIKVYRPEAEVFKPEAMQSFASKPITDNHPEQMLDVENVKEHIVGYVTGEITRDGDTIVAEVTVVDKATIEKIKDGKVELSNGYYSNIEWKTGTTPEGEHYDAIQTDIRGNHVAIVERGRCGATCKISDSKPNHNGDHSMKITINGVDFEVTDQVGQAVNGVIAQLDSANTTIDEMKTQVQATTDGHDSAIAALNDQHKAEQDALQAKLDSAVAAAPTPETMDALVQARTETVARATALVDGFEHMGKTCDAIKKEVVAAKCADVDIDKVSVDYINARFDALATGVSNGVDAALQQSIKDGSKDDKDKDTVTDAREKFMARNRDAWNPNKKEA